MIAPPIELLKRLRGWDMLDVCADGPYWRAEIDAVINSQIWPSASPIIGRLSAAPEIAAPVLTRDDYEQIAEGIEHFIIGDCTDLEPIWLPYVTKLRAAAAAETTAPQGWQDIASAPKDGSRFLGCDKDREITICHWDRDKGYEAWRDDEWERLHCLPIYWMPLPTRPSSLAIDAMLPAPPSAPVDKKAIRCRGGAHVYDVKNGTASACDCGHIPALDTSEHEHRSPDGDGPLSERPTHETKGEPQGSTLRTPLAAGSILADAHTQASETLARFIATVDEMEKVVRGFKHQAENGVICVPRDNEHGMPQWNAKPSRTWCIRCCSLWSRLFAVVSKQSEIAADAHTPAPVEAPDRHTPQVLRRGEMISGYACADPQHNAASEAWVQCVNCYREALDSARKLIQDLIPAETPPRDPMFAPNAPVEAPVAPPATLLIDHVGCGTVDEHGRCVRCDEIRRRLAALDAMRAELESAKRLARVNLGAELDARMALSMMRLRAEAAERERDTLRTELERERELCGHADLGRDLVAAESALAALQAEHAALKADYSRIGLEKCDKCKHQVPRDFIAIEIEDGHPIDDPAGFQWCVICHDQRVVSQLKAEHAALRELVQEFVAYWLRDDGCGMCGGSTHSTTCYVGRFAALSGVRGGKA